MYLSRKSRKLDPSQESFIYNLSKKNIGVAMAHRIMSYIQVRYSTMGGFVIDYKNFQRNLIFFVGNRDAHCVINKIEERMVNVPNFTFKYRDIDGVLDARF